MTKRKENEVAKAIKLATEDNEQQEEKKELSCFIIMPIADMHGYENNHFNRVYNHVIKPACEAAGFKPIRADEINNSNFIVLDILRRIVECDLAICDLSGRNPNVMYELGLRQAFNKKTVLIKDDKTISPFDVQAFRYCSYDSSLRIDNAFNNIQSLVKALTDTYNADSDDVNSIVQLLKIQPAQVGDKTQLSTQETVILESIRELSKRVDNIGKQTDKSAVWTEKPNSISKSLSSFAVQKDYLSMTSLIGRVYNHPTSKTPLTFRGQDIVTDNNGDEMTVYSFEDNDDTYHYYSLNSSHLNAMHQIM